MEVRPWVVRRKDAPDHPAIVHLAETLGKWFNPEGLNGIRRDLPAHQGFVAIRGDAVIGFATWNPVDAEIANLSWMGVAEADQHRGIGTTLLAAIVEDVRRLGLESLEVSTVADSVDYAPYADTRRFYRARGFQDYRVDVSYFGPPDDRYDRLLLRLDVIAPAAP